MRRLWTCRWLGRLSAVWLVQSAEGIGGKLATFTDFNLVAKVRYAKVLCFAFVISHIGLLDISVVSPSFKRSLSHLAQVQSEKKSAEHQGICSWLSFNHVRA